ncbi:alpha/beta fold hydrolase [Monashia sp. NPDC004114]
MFSPSAGGDPVSAFIDSLRAVRPDGFRAMTRACFEDQSHVLPEIDVPTLLMYPDHDVRAPAAVGEAIRAAVPSSELVVLPDQAT